MRTRVAVSGSCRRPEKTQAPVDFISSSSTWICFQDCCISSWVIGSPTSPSTVWTDNRYCAMVVLPSLGAGTSRLSPLLRTGLAQIDTCAQEEPWPCAGAPGRESHLELLASDG